MKIAVFSDIHGNLEVLEAIIASINKKNINVVFCLGDVIGKGPKPKECLDLIIENKINLVLGNSELYYLKGTSIDPMSRDDEDHFNWTFEQLNDKHKSFLEECKLNVSLKINGCRISFRHFLIADKDNPYPFHLLSVIKEGKIKRLVEDLNDDYVFVGHEHSEFVIKSGNTTVIDVGSSGCVKKIKTFYHIIDITDKLEYERVELKYDRASFINSVNNIDYPNKEKAIESFGL